MSDDHITVAFTTEEAMIEFPCPTGADHMDQIPVRPETVAYCLCGWMFVQKFSPGWGSASDVARTLAVMQAREHQRNPLKGR
jgi:hypothetical protein